MSSEIRKNIHIEILKYAQEHTEFIKDELMEDLKFTQEEKDLFVVDNQHPGKKGNEIAAKEIFEFLIKKRLVLAR